MDTVALLNWLYLIYVCVIDFGHSDIDKYDIPVFSHS